METSFTPVMDVIFYCWQMQELWNNYVVRLAFEILKFTQKLGDCLLCPDSR